MVATEEPPRVSPNLVPNSLETQPPSPALLNTSRPPQMDQVRVKPPTRTYGKRVVAVEDSKEVGAGGDGSAKPLERHSTVVVPETDPDHDTEESEERDVTVRGRTTTNSSSPPQTDPRSTSPTSSEGGDAVQERVKATNNLLCNLSDESSDEEEGEKGGNVIDFFKKHGNIDDQLKAVDREMDERQDSPHRPAQITAPTSSSLPTLTDSDAPSRSDSSSQPTPTTRLQQSSSVQILDPAVEDEDSQDVLVPTARSRKARARILDSDDEEEEEEAIVRPRQVSAAPRKSVLPASSDNEGDVASSPVRRESSAPGPSKQERLQALAAKKKAAMPRPISPPQRERIVSDIDDGSSDEGKSEKKKSKKSLSKPKIKALSKKNEDEMHKQSAAFAREQETRLEPIVKKKMSVVDTLKSTSHRHSLAPSAPRRAPVTQEIVVLESSDPIISTSSPRSKTPQISRPSAKALGKQRQHSPIDLDHDSTPRQRRSMTVPRPEAWGKLAVQQQPVKQASSSDSEEELLPMEEMIARNQRREEEKKAQLAQAAAKENERKMNHKLREKKIRDARARAAAEDDDSDLEIEGRPSLSSNRRVASTPQPGTELDHVMRDFAHVDPSHHHTSEDDPTDSQFKTAGKEFGHHLGPNHQYVPSPTANQGAKRRPASKAHQPVTITQDSLSRMLVEKAQRQAIESRLEKMSNSRKQQQDQGEAPKAGTERLDVQGMLEKKKEQQQEQQQEDDVLEEMDDPDYQAGFDEEEEEEAQMSEQGDEDGSGSDTPVSKKGAQEMEEGDFDSEGELVLPPSSQNSDRHGQREVARRVNDDDDEDADDEDAPIARRTTTVKPRVVFEEDEEEEGASPDKFLVPTVPATAVAPAATTGAAPAPVRMMLDDFGGDEGGGFSQFFDSQFDQNAPGAFEGEGFGRAPEPTAFNPASTMAVLQPLISTAERIEDAARLEARGAVHNIEPGTPREAAIPRQYINKQGFMTQTRPVNMFGDSPAYSPRDSQNFQESLSTTRDSQSQGFTQTQVDATPTQAVRHPNQLRRQNALVRDDSLSDAQPDPTEVVEEESFPSAAQPPTANAPPRDAFSALRQGAALASIPEKNTKHRREKNAFVDDQANLDSDEEQAGGLNAASGDEDEEGHDAELDELVDNQAISEELQAVQDARARELHQEELDKREAADLKRAQNIADGKERNKRKQYELDDDDFDDEFMANERREKKARIDNMTTTELLANEKTRAFAQQLQTTCVAQHKAGDLDMFEPSQRSDDERDEDDEDLIEETQEEDVFGGVRVKVNTTYSSVRAEAVRKQRELEELQLNSEDLETQMEIHLGNSSSPVVAFKTNNRIQAAASKSALPQPRRTDNYDEIESQYSFGKTDSIHSLVNYKGDSRDDSQTGNGVAAGGRSAVTSFQKGPLKSTTSLSSTSLGGGKGSKSNSRTALGPKSSKFSSIRKGSGGFAS